MTFIDPLYSSAFHYTCVKDLEVNQIRLLCLTSMNFKTVTWNCGTLVCSFPYIFFES